MNNRQLLDALGQVEDRYIEAAAPGKQHGKSSRWVRGLAIAACLCLMLAGAVQTLLRFDYLSAGCSAWPGAIVDGTYYYNVAHRGVYCYTPEGESRKLLSTFWEEGWLVNDYGLYYKRGRSLFVRVHETGQTQRLYTAGWLDCTHIGFSLQQDGTVVLTEYNKHTEMRRELLLDGGTGKVLETVLEPTSYDDIFRDAVLPYSDSHFQVGSREVDLVPTGEANRCDLLEDGESILPEGVRISRWASAYFGPNLWLSCEEEEDSLCTYFVLRPDGNDFLITLPNHYYEAGTEDFLFYVDVGVWCLELATGAQWKLEAPEEWAFYSLATDGDDLYSCVPWDDAQTCWRLIYTDGRPSRLELVEGDITP